MRQPLGNRWVTGGAGSEGRALSLGASRRRRRPTRGLFLYCWFYIVSSLTAFRLLYRAAPPVVDACALCWMSPIW